MLSVAQAEALKTRVSSGATLLASVFTGLTDEYDTVHPGGAPGPLRELLGLWVEETDAVMASDKNGVRFNDGETFQASLLCDRVRLESAEAVAVYTSDFYAGEPSVTRNAFGEGTAWYVATQLDADGIRRIVWSLCRERGIGSPLADGVAPPASVEVTQRGELLYLLNHGEPVNVALAPGSWTDLLTGEALRGAAVLELRGVRVLRLS